MVHNIYLSKTEVHTECPHVEKNLSILRLLTTGIVKTNHKYRGKKVMSMLKAI